MGLNIDRNIIHIQTIMFNKGSFDIEISWEKMKFYILVKRNMKVIDPKVENNLFLKQMWIPQAK
jgi:hypothetical protein